MYYIYITFNGKTHILKNEISYMCALKKLQFYCVEH